MPVSDRHPLYDEAAPQREIVRDCVKGSQAVKGARNSESEGSNGFYNYAGTKYLPAPNADDQSSENQLRYQAYKVRASFVNFTGHTKDGFMGMIGRIAPEIELPANLDYLIDNGDGAGLPLRQLAQNNISELLEVGMNGLLSEFPMSEGGTAAQTADLQATIKQYPAESIISFRQEVINGKKKLTSVVLAEDVEKSNGDESTYECVTYHRELLLDDGVYKQNIYDEDDNLLFFENEGELSPDLIPRKFDKSLWTEIPFEFSGAINNDPIPDKAPLYDLAEINISHYRNSADFEESAFMVGQPTVAIIGLTNSWWKDVLNKTLRLGSRGGIPLPVGGDVKLVQASPNQMPERGMELKEAQMIKTGAKVITDSSGVETAEAAKIRFAGQNSKLALVVSNTESSLKKAIGWCGEFMGVVNEDILIDINKKFYEATVNPQLLIANMQLLDRGVIAMSDIRNQMRRAGQIEPDRADEDIDNEQGQANPLL